MKKLIFLTLVNIIVLNLNCAKLSVAPALINDKLKITGHKPNDNNTYEIKFNYQNQSIPNSKNNSTNGTRNNLQKFVDLTDFQYAEIPEDIKKVTVTATSPILDNNTQTISFDIRNKDNIYHITVENGNLKFEIKKS